MVEEGVEAARDAVAEGLVPGDGEEEEHVLELLGGEAAFEHAGHDVVGRLLALLGGQGVGVGEHVGQGRVRAGVEGTAVGADGGGTVLHGLAGHGGHRGGVGGGEAGVVVVLVADDAGRPVVQEAAVGFGDAHDVGEGPDGEVGREFDEVGVLVQGRGDEGAGPGVDRVFQGADGAGGERGGDDAAEAGVAGRVLVEHHRADEGEVLGRVGVADLGGAEVGGEQVRGAQDLLHVGVPEDRPVSGAGGPGADGRFRDPRDGGFGAQAFERLVRDAGRVGGRQEDLLAHAPSVHHVGCDGEG
ncbi:hypothetical protein [Actinomadura hallensis]|uniref:hypothetical protein n=1 Tax=Actinomadura hallensis TaxID=337895 RepID=UPI00163A5EC3|nr:hypothetical protein [Actinomadura hallensis]